RLTVGATGGRPKPRINKMAKVRVKLLKPWHAAPGREPGEIVGIDPSRAEYGIKMGLCEPVEKLLGKMNKAELIEKAAALKIEVPGNFTKKQLVELLREKNL
ncbi:MAG: hypothetical protein U9N45_00130, partial [Gemmatimonadota bacterium]|nr:hypothetical protein [Gemmatimonadota bacterium]